MSDILGEDAHVRAAFRAAGWSPGRRSEAVDGWVETLKARGFVIHELARRIWTELGELRILPPPRGSSHTPLFIDPVDACGDRLDELKTLNEKLDDSFAPLGMWSNQFPSYVGANGRVVAVTIVTLFELGSTFPEALDAIVNGGEDKIRETRVDWL